MPEKKLTEKQKAKAYVEQHKAPTASSSSLDSLTRDLNRLTK